MSEFNRKCVEGPAEILGCGHKANVQVADSPLLNAEQQLIEAAVAGERTAQDAIARRLSRRVHRLTMMLCPTPADAEDASQRALVEILHSLGSYRADASLEAWADRIAVRVARHEVSKNRRRHGLMERWLAPGAMPFCRSTPAQPHEPTDLLRILMQLSPERREALVLRHVLEYTVEEVASITGARLGTTRDRLLTARKQLRRWLGKGASRRGGSDPESGAGMGSAFDEE